MLSREEKTKSGFLTRLSSLILIQIVFVFAALALVIYIPNDASKLDSVVGKLVDRFESASDILASAPVDPIDAPPLTDSLEALIARNKSAGDGFAAVVLYATDTAGDPYVLRMLGETDESCLWTIGVSPETHEGQLRSLLALPAGFGATSFRNDGHIVHEYRVDLTDGRPALVLGVVSHEIGLASRADLIMVLLVVFIASAVISSLIVWMIRKRFQWPLNRLLRGLQKTSEGEMFVMSENFDDAELDELATAFNTMSRRLWQNRQELTDYNRRLKKLNVSLLESQLFFSTLVESSPLCIVVTSPSGQILLFNRQASRDFGYKSSDAIGKNINELFSGSASGGQVNLEATDDGAAFETRCRRRGGDYFPAYIISRPARARDGTISAYIYIIKDISESKGFQDMMVRLDRYYTRGEMAGDIAHEINNYLSILLGNIELMPIILRSGDEAKIEKKLAIMKDTADRIANFTDGLVEGPQDEAHVEASDLNQVVANVLAFLKPQNKFDDVDLRSDLSPDLSLVDLDSGQIQQLLVNFVYNAADALHEREGEYRITVRTLSVERNLSHYARIEVQDNGPGVLAEKRDLLFQRRFTTKKKGHGIGLITCRKIAELHGGDIGYEFRDGAVFWCEFPIKAAGKKAQDSHDDQYADVLSSSAAPLD